MSEDQPPVTISTIEQSQAQKYPEIADILNELVATFPGGGELATPEIVAQCQAVWQELNAKVDVEKMLPDEAARWYLVENGLIEE